MHNIKISIRDLYKNISNDSLANWSKNIINSIAVFKPYKFRIYHSNNLIQ